MSQTMQQTDGGSLRDIEDGDKKKQTKSRRPPNTAFRQQRLKAWQPILTPKTVLPLFFAVGIIFAPIGGLLLWTSAKVQEINIDYSECATTAPNCTEDGSGYQPIPDGKVTQYFKNQTDPGDVARWCQDHRNVTFGQGANARQHLTSVCHLQFHTPDVLEPPVLLYYQLTNFYQNHRRYVKSFDQDQLAGQARDAGAINNSNCDPLKGELDGNTGVWKPYYPCGLIANSMFNDSIGDPIALNPRGGGLATAYNMTTKGTAWSSDATLYQNTSYKPSDVLPPPNWRERYPAYNETFPFPDLNGMDDFQVWMRTAGLPTFIKLYRRNDSAPMQIGTYQLAIDDHFPVLKYQGTKSILISTRTVMGGRNPFLGIAYVVVGGLCVLLGALFTVTQLIRPRKLGDHSYLSWTTEPATATTTGRAPRPNETA